MSNGPDGMNKLAEFAQKVGIPVVALFWLLYWLPQMDRRLTEIVLLLQQHVAR